MKNIHIIETRKPSRIHKIGNEFGYTDKPNANPFAKQQNIYITSDEYVLPNDYLIHNNVLYRCMTCCEDFIHIYGHKSKNREQCKKIVLTTDTTLINDGIQQIDDNFLSWFIENPNREYIDVDYAGVYSYDTKKETIEDEYYNFKTIEGEKIEEAAKRLWEQSHPNPIEMAIFGANWQATQMYTEEEVKNILVKYLHYLTIDSDLNADEWFEKYKK